MNIDRLSSLRDQLFGLVQLLLPTRALSSLVHRLTRIEHPGFKNALIRLFIRGFSIDLSEAEYAIPENYSSFNHFFTRALQPGMRPIAPDPQAFISPVDGTIAQFGDIRDGRIFQAKGHAYSVLELLAGDQQAAQAFMHGRFCTIYLAPYNYHRIHMPLTGRLQRWSHVPGRLFSVNAATARALPNLYARNERLNALFESDSGPFGMVLVGALFVGSLETVWAGQVSPPHLRGAPSHYQTMSPVILGRGEEMGRFNMGSTVILLSTPDSVEWAADLAPGRTVRMGETIGRLKPAR